MVDDIERQRKLERRAVPCARLKERSMGLFLDNVILKHVLQKVNFEALAQKKVGGYLSFIGNYDTP